MALTKQQWKDVSEAMETLRAMGCAVCVFTPDDVESARDHDDDKGKPLTAEEAKDWMDRNRKHLEDRLSEQGNLYIADNLDD